MGVGAIVGIVIGVLAALCAAAGATWYIIRRKRNQKLAQREAAETEKKMV